MDEEKLVKEWLAVDRNASTRREIETLYKNKDYDELQKRLGSRIMFGTAGLRARMEAGFSRMNDVTVIQASQGLAEYILSQKPPQQPSVVVGHDHRHNSSTFAHLAASVFLLKGFKVYFLGHGVVPTPFVPFAIDHYGALGGVMVTASHNPAADNGYKVYWGNGCQIVPPHDALIQEHIMQNLTLMEGVWDYREVYESRLDSVVFAREEIAKLYHKSIRENVIKSKVDSSFRAVYTPMHGVGWEEVEKVAGALGIQLEVVTKQADPDPDFPTVSFPNPEEKHALDLAMDTADSKGIDLVLANDPDADRFSAAVKVDGEWRQLTGNEIGFLFAEYIVGVLEASGQDMSKVYLLNSTVSSQMIKSLARVKKCNYVDTLTGFKWIGNKAIDLESEGYKVPFGFEEAIGFMFPPVHDKDGIAALAVFVQMYQAWRGRSAAQMLHDGFAKYGFYKECNGYYVVPQLDTTEKIFTAIRSRGVPSVLGDYKVIYWRDLTTGFDSSTDDHKPTLHTDPSSQMITASLQPSSGGLVRFTARGSGTEPKLKVYIEATAESETKASQLGQSVWDLLRDTWFLPSSFNLKEVV